MKATFSFAGQLKWHAYVRAKSAQWYWHARSSEVIAGRMACLGHDVVKVLAPQQRVLNLQKGRVDYVADCAENLAMRARSERVVPHIGRPAIVDCVAQEALVGSWLSIKRPKLLFMDSMAELGDQLFIHRRDSWRFLSAYTDVTHSPSFAETFDARGLLPVNELRSHFARFFTCVRDRFGPIPVIYLHFPATLEARMSFRDRHYAIRDALASIALEFANISPIAVDDRIVSRPANVLPEMADFAYHYNYETYVRFAELVRETPAWRDMTDAEHGVA